MKSHGFGVFFGVGGLLYARAGASLWGDCGLPMTHLRAGTPWGMVALGNFHPDQGCPWGTTACRGPTRAARGIFWGTMACAGAGRGKGQWVDMFICWPQCPGLRVASEKGGRWTERTSRWKEGKLRLEGGQRGVMLGWSQGRGRKGVSLSVCLFFSFNTQISNQKFILIGSKLSEMPWVKTVLPIDGVCGQHWDQA